MNQSNMMKDTNPKEKHAFRIFLVTFILTLGVGIYFTVLALQDTRPLYFYAPNIQALILSLASLLGMVFVRNKRIRLAMRIFLSTFSFVLIVTAFFYGGLDIVLAFLLLLIFLGIASTFFRKEDVNKLLASSFAVASAIVLIGFWDPFERTYYGLDTVTITFVILLSIIYGVFLLRRYRTFALRTKLILAFIFLSAVGIGIAFTFMNANVRNVLQSNSQQTLLAGSSSVAASVDSYLENNLDAVSVAATYSDMRAYLLLPEENRRGTTIERQVQNILHSLSNRDPSIISFGILDLAGVNVLDSKTTNIGQNEGEHDYYQKTLVEEKPYISSILYLPNSDISIFFCAPIFNDMGGMTGILRAQYKASALQELVMQQEKIAGEGAFSVLVDSNDIIIVHEQNENLHGKIVGSRNPNEIEILKFHYFLPAEIPAEQLVLGFENVEAALDNFETTPYFSSPEALNTPVVGAITQLKEAPWYLLAIQPEDVFLSPAQRQTQIALATAMVVIALAAFSGFWLANILAAPILSLKNTAQKFAEGDLAAKAAIETEDEIGDLAVTFNDLTSRLRLIINTLEDRVEERTQDLALRSAYLEGAAEVSHAAATFTDAEELSWRVVELIRERFNLYYVGLFLAEGEWAVLHAGTGQAGQTMLANNHQLKIGEGMIGWAVEHGEARIALDVGDDAVRFENPVLPETRSEGALPLRSRGRVLGALTVQSREPAAFTVEIITTLQTMADQIAVAFDNAELFAQSEAALEAERRAYGEASFQSWQSLKQSDNIPTYRVTAQGDLEAIAQKGIEPEEDLDPLTTTIPIKSRGFVIGGIRITKKEDSGKWTNEQLQLVETISEQLSVALESARLFEETQRKAQREAIISDISAKVGASIRVDSILRTTVQELGKALDGAEVAFEITGPEKGEQAN